MCVSDISVTSEPWRSVGVELRPRRGGNDVGQSRVSLGSLWLGVKQIAIKAFLLLKYSYRLPETVSKIRPKSTHGEKSYEHISCGKNGYTLQRRHQNIKIKINI